jgi:hypothetical protein
MQMRFVIGFCALFATAVPAGAQEPKPTVIISAKPVSRLLSEYREMLLHVGGPAQGERFVKEFETDLKEMFGEHGFEGIDINRPFAAYTVVREKLEETNMVMVVPVTGEKEFLAFLQRLRFKSTPVKDKKGLYTLELAEPGFLLAHTSHVQFSDGGWAYVGLNGDEVAEAKNRLPVADLFDNADQTLISAKLFPARFPEKVLKNWLEEMDIAANGAKRFFGALDPQDGGKVFLAVLDEGPKQVRRYAETGLKEASEISIQFSWEPTSGETFTELVLTPKPGTPLAKEIATRPATIQRFAGLVPTNAAVGVAAQAPLFTKEVRAIVEPLVGLIEGEAKHQDLPEAFRPLVEELGKSIQASVKKGDLDGAIALTGPDKGGKFTLVGAISLTDTTAIDKAVRQAAKSADLGKQFELDAAKVGEVTIHKVPLARAAHENMLRGLNRITGEEPPSYIALAKDAVFVSYGPESLAAIKAAIEAKPGPAPVLELTGNMNRLHKLVALLAGDVGADQFAKALGTDDKPVNMLRITVEGGQTFKAKVTMNLRHIPKFFIISEHVAKAP